MCQIAVGNVKLPALMGDNMVLQRQSSITIWGWADPGESVRVKAGWTTSPLSVVAGNDGKWQVRLETSNAGGPYELAIEGKNRIVLKNIMLGEVWLCSGQSNMEFTIKMLGGWTGPFGPDREDLVKNRYSSLRLFTVAKDTSSVPRDTCRGSWLLPDPDVVENFSATAYFFGRELARKLNVPVGLISSSWGGTPAEAWTPLEELKKDKNLAFFLNDTNKTSWFPARPAVLFNAMINPLIRYPVKGAIWYQGESNRNDAQLYHLLMGTLIGSWRNRWNVGSFPFYFVQIAPYAYEEPFSGALLREAQLKTLAVPNTGMAVTMDIGDANDIHPKNKQEVGRRLALWAFAHAYGVKVPAFSGPLYRSMKREGNTVRVAFDYAEGGLVARGEKVSGFVVSGPDRAFVDAEATIDGSTIVVSSPKVSEPVAVRFSFTNTAESGLFNRAGLPASSFRTDDWPVVTATVSLIATVDSARNGIRFDAVSRSPGVEIRYTLDGSEPTLLSPIFSEKVHLTTSGSIMARAFKDGVASSAIAQRDFVRHEAFGAPATYAFPYDARYNGGGKAGLVDGLSGSDQFRDGSWQGFKKVDLDVTIDLGDTLKINEIRTGFLQNQSSWIFFPRDVEYSVSPDGKSFVAVAKVTNDSPDSTIGSIRKNFSATVNKATARFLRVKATSIGQCPQWHPGRGQDAWLFVDEIRVN